MNRTSNNSCNGLNNTLYRSLQITHGLSVYTLVKILFTILKMILKES